MDTPEDRFYNPTKINAWFAISALVTAAATVAAILADHYDREWKDYQAAFHAMEKDTATRLLALRDAPDSQMSAGARGVANTLLRGDAGAATGPSSLDDAAFAAAIKSTRGEADFAAGAVLAARAFEAEAAALETGEIETKQNALKVKRDQAEADRFRTEKEQRELQALVDQYKFEMDHAKGAGHDAEAKAAYARWSEADAHEKEVHARMDGFALLKTDIVKEMRDLHAPAVKLRDRAKKVLDAAGVAAAERKMAGFIVSGLRDAPLIDFPAPVKKIEQRVIPDLTVDYNFANIPRVDRCMTCHTGIDKVRVDPVTGRATAAFGEKDASGKEIPRVSSLTT